MHQKKKEGDKKIRTRKSLGSKRIWQMDESEKPRRKTNGTTRPNHQKRLVAVTVMAVKI